MIERKECGALFARAAEYVRDGWSQEAEARAAPMPGEKQGPGIGPRNTSAKAWSINGALERAYAEICGNPFSPNDREIKLAEARRILAYNILGEVGLRRVPRWTILGERLEPPENREPALHWLEEWNDDPSRTREGVIFALLRASVSTHEEEGALL